MLNEWNGHQTEQIIIINITLIYTILMFLWDNVRDIYQIKLIISVKHYNKILW